MNKAKRTLLVCCYLFVLLLLSALFIPTKQSALVCTVFLAVCAPVFSLLLKKRTLFSHNKRQVTALMCALGVLYLFLLFLLGAIFGFSARNGNVYTWDNLLLYLFPTVIAILLFEYLRSILLASNNRQANALTYLAGILCEVFLYTSLWDVDSFYQFMDTVAMVCLPAITGGILYQYLCKRYGWLPSAIYRLFTTVAVLLLPVSFDIPDAITASLKLILPLLIYAFLDALYEQKKKPAVRKSHVVSYVITAVCFVLATAALLLLSGRFRFGALVVASPSMRDEINKGDVIVYEACGDTFAEKGDILVFHRGETIVVHRIIDIQTINGETRYQTKGDANETADPGYVLQKDVIGIVHFKVPMVGYPTLALRELFS